MVRCPDWKTLFCAHILAAFLWIQLSNGLRNSHNRLLLLFRPFPSNQSGILLGLSKENNGQHLLSRKDSFDLLWHTFISLCTFLWLFLQLRCVTMNRSFVANLSKKSFRLQLYFSKRYIEMFFFSFFISNFSCRISCTSSVKMTTVSVISEPSHGDRLLGYHGFFQYYPSQWPQLGVQNALHL